MPPPESDHWDTWLSIVYIDSPEFQEWFSPITYLERALEIEPENFCKPSRGSTTELRPISSINTMEMRCWMIDVLV